MRSAALHSKHPGLNNVGDVRFGILKLMTSHALPFSSPKQVHDMTENLR